MTKSGACLSLSAGLAVFITLAISFSPRLALAGARLLRLAVHESLAVAITIDFVEWQDKDYPHVIE
jgi:hypothetical protein